ncbi:MAG: AI-2E family transporter [Cyanobacteria bacterium P01_A01_bin.114]
MKFCKLVGLVALLLGLYLLWQIRFIVLLAFTAVALATVLNRVVRQLTRWRLQRGLAITVTLVTIFAVIAIALTIVVPRFVDQFSQWLDQVPLEVAQISIWLNQIEGRLPAEFADQLQKLDTFIRDIPQIARSVFNNFFLFFRGTLSFLVNALLVLAVTIMLLANPRAYRRAFVLLFPQFYRQRLQEILDHCERSLVGWGVGILFNMAVIMIMSFTGLVLIGVPLPIGNALIAGLLTFIPNVGPVLSVVPPAVLGLLETPWKAGAVVVLYIVIQQVESNFLTPLVMKRQVSLLPALTLVSQLICGVLFGFLGLFLALPLIVIGQVWLQELLVNDIMNRWRKKSFLSENLSENLSAHHEPVS